MIPNNALDKPSKRVKHRIVTPSSLPISLLPLETEFSSHAKPPSTKSQPRYLPGTTYDGPSVAFGMFEIGRVLGYG